MAKRYKLDCSVFLNYKLILLHRSVHLAVDLIVYSQWFKNELNWAVKFRFLHEGKYHSNLELISSLTGLDSSSFTYIKIYNRFTCFIESKPVKMEVSCTLFFALWRKSFIFRDLCIESLYRHNLKGNGIRTADLMCKKQSLDHPILRCFQGVPFRLQVETFDLEDNRLHAGGCVLQVNSYLTFTLVQLRRFAALLVAGIKHKIRRYFWHRIA